MRLSNYLNYCKIIRDAKFSTFDKVYDLDGENVFSYAGNIKFIKRLLKCDNVSAILCKKEDLTEELMNQYPKIGFAVSDNPEASFFRIFNYYAKNEYNGDDKTTVIGKDCQISSSAKIAGKGVIIGDNVEIEDNVVIYPGVQIQDGVAIRCGAVLGMTSLEVKRDVDGNNFWVDAIGKVVIGQNAQIGYNATVGKGTFNQQITYIGENTCIADHCSVNHGCKIGRNVKMMVGSIVCGYTVIEDGVTIGPGAVVTNRTKIGENAQIRIGAVVASKVNKNETVAGNYAMEDDLFKRNRLNILRG